MHNDNGGSYVLKTRRACMLWLKHSLGGQSRQSASLWIKVLTTAKTVNLRFVLPYCIKAKTLVRLCSQEILSNLREYLENNLVRFAWLQPLRIRVFVVNSPLDWDFCLSFFDLKVALRSLIALFDVDHRYRPANFEGYNYNCALFFMMLRSAYVTEWRPER